MLIRHSIASKKGAVSVSKPSTSWQTKWPERISYGLSDAADNLVFQVMTTYLLFFIPIFMAYKPAPLPYSF